MIARASGNLPRLAAVAAAVVVCVSVAPVARGSAPSATQSSLNAVSCPPRGHCVAVGEISAGTAVRPLVEVLHGASWTTRDPAAVGRSSQLTGVSCPSDTFCMAVGAQPKHGALTERWTAGAWTREPVLEPPGTTTLAAVSCVSPSFCVAVGGTPLEQPLIELWNGVTWTRMRSPGSHGSSDGLLSGVSCPSTTSCVAVGTSFADDVNGALIERYADGRWTRLPLRSRHDQTLRAVSCPTASWCVGVGTSTAPGSATIDALAVQIGIRHVATLGTPSAVAASLAGVSCAAARRCVAVGATPLAGQTGDTAGEAPFAQAFLLGAWEAQSAPLQGSSSAFSGGVACRAPTRCVAVGFAVDAVTGVIAASAETLGATGWTPLLGR